MDKSISIDVAFKPFSIQKMNDQFTRCKCYVMALGKNRNFSYFSKPTVDSALPTLYYIPVVAHLLYDEENDKWYVGGHDREWTEDHSLKDLTVPYGVVMNTETSYEDVIEASGAVSTYLTCDVILWTGRYCDLLKAAYDDEVYFGQSMEIIPKASCKLPEDNKYQEITDFTFSCLTLLGKSDQTEYHTEPCFPSASIVPFENDPDGEKFKLMFSEMKAELEKYGVELKQNTASGSDNKEEKILNEKMELLARFGVTAEELDFSIDDIDLGELETKLMALKDSGEPTAEPETNFELNLIDRLNEIRIELHKHTVTTDWGYEMPRYWLLDVQDDEVIVEDYEDDYRVYGLKLIESGDAISLDFENKKRKKRKFEDFDFGDGSAEPKNYAVTADILGKFSAKITELQSALTARESELQTAQDTYASLEAKYNELNTQYAEIQASAIKDQLDAVFAKFDSELAGIEAYDVLKEHCELSPAELEEKCFALVGQKKFSYTPAKKPEGVTKFGVSGNQNEDRPYGGLIEKYKK